MQLVVLPHDTYHLCVCGCRVCQCVFVCVRGMWLGVWHATHGRRLELLGSLRGPLGDPQAAGQHVVAFFFSPASTLPVLFCPHGGYVGCSPLARFMSPPAENSARIRQNALVMALRPPSRQRLVTVVITCSYLHLLCVATRFWDRPTGKVVSCGKRR